MEKIMSLILSAFCFGGCEVKLPPLPSIHFPEKDLVLLFDYLSILWSILFSVLAVPSCSNLFYKKVINPFQLEINGVYLGIPTSIKLRNKPIKEMRFYLAKVRLSKFRGMNKDTWKKSPRFFSCILKRVSLDSIIEGITCIIYC